MNSKGLQPFKKAALRITGSAIALILLIVILLYTPFVQNMAKNFAIEKIEQSTNFRVSLGKFRLHFPLNLELQNLAITQQGDTMLSASEVNADIAFLPLLRQRIKISELSLIDARYIQGTADSALYINAHIDKFTTQATELSMNIQEILIGENTLLDGANIHLALNDTVTTPTDTSTTGEIAMTIAAPQLQLRNIHLQMTIPQTIDSLNTHIGIAELIGGNINLLSKNISAQRLSIDSLTAYYFTPKATPGSKKPDSASSNNSSPWSINISEIYLSAPQAIYAQSESKPTPGLDIKHIAVSDTKIRIDSFFNRGTELRVPLKELSLTERCGLTLNASGLFKMDSTAMRLEDFQVKTPKSLLLIDANLGMGDFAKNATLPLLLIAKGEIAIADITTAYPTLKPLSAGYPQNSALTLDSYIHGTTGQLNIDKINASITGLLSLNASGNISNPMDFNRMSGQITLDGKVQNVNPLKNKILDQSTAKLINTPPMTIRGKVDYNPRVINGDVAVATASGEIALDALWNQRSEGYDITLNSDNLPLQEIIPTLGIGNITAIATLQGHGYAPTKASTSISANIDIAQITYNDNQLSDISVKASIDSCTLTGRIYSPNHIAALDANINARLTDSIYSWDLIGDIQNIDLKALKLSATPLSGKMALHSTGHIRPQSRSIAANIDINNLNWLFDKNRLTLNQAKATLNTADSLTSASIETDDLKARATALCGIDTLLTSITRAAEIINSQLTNRNIHIPELQQALPTIDLDISSGRNNVLTRYLAETADIQFQDAKIKFTNDSLISFLSEINSLKMGKTRLDTVSLRANQRNKFLTYNLRIDNKPGTMDDFAHIDLSGFLSRNKLSAILKQANIANQQGFFLGITTNMTDSKLTANFHPATPTIAYKKWALNSDNFVTFDFQNKHLDANLSLKSDSSSLKLYTEHPHSDTIARGQEDMILELKNIDLAEWLSISPFAPPIKGDVDADMRFRWDREYVVGKGTLNLNELYYGKERVGSFDLALKLANNNRRRALHADASLLIDNQKVITASGHVNDSTATNPFLLDFSMIHFPLRVVNPFLSKNVAQLSGMLNGTMNITGDIANPIFNGYLDFDSTAVKVGITGMPYKFSEDKIPVDSNVIKFKDFAIEGLNNNHLFINGAVDARRINDIAVDLTATARDMQIVNSSRPKGANVYGKAYLDLDATIKGNMSLMRVDAALNILGGTNVTYVISDAVQALTPQSAGNMVKFVNLSDTTSILTEEKPQEMPMQLLLNAELTISDGSTINVDLSPDGKNKVSISGSGNLTYTQTPMSTDGRLTGRYTINSGFINYTPQIASGGFSMALMKEKSFKFQEGSYIAFTGDMLNPTLNISATDEVKANVTQQGQNSRLVNFNIILKASNTLRNMDVSFDLTTNDDLTIQNELQGMSPEQRANQAMNMLLYNQYTGPGSKGNANLSGNPLYTFLASQLNSWMASNINGVDISFGIDQYDKTIDGAESTTTSYNYRVSKSLFDNRFKIVVGGNYSTDADADENFSQNLINDISFEYLLNRSGSMYIKLFRHVGYESILEGEITQTGVGFVLKRKINSLRDIFRFGQSTQKPKSTNNETPQTK